MIVSDPKQCIVSELNMNLLQGKDNKANGVQVNKKEKLQWNGNNDAIRNK